jgi:hypothetical protein
VAGRDEHRVDRFGVEPAGDHLGAQLARRVVGRPRVSVRARLQHRVVRVGRREQARGRRQHHAADAAVVARAVHALVVRRRQQADPLQRLGSLEDPLHVVHVQPHPFLVARVQRTGLVPHRAGHAEAADVVHERGAPRERRLLG